MLSQISKEKTGEVVKPAPVFLFEVGSWFLLVRAIDATRVEMTARVT
jgi:hypothetical protein